MNERSRNDIKRQSCREKKKGNDEIMLCKCNVEHSECLWRRPLLHSPQLIKAFFKQNIINIIILNWAFDEKVNENLCMCEWLLHTHTPVTIQSYSAIRAHLLFVSFRIEWKFFGSTFLFHNYLTGLSLANIQTSVFIVWTLEHLNLSPLLFVLDFSLFSF